MIAKSLVWDRAPFQITIGDGTGKKVEVSGWVDQQKLWGIHRLGETYVVTHLPTGLAVTAFGGAAGKRATARTFCAAINRLTDWRRADIGRLLRLSVDGGTRARAGRGGQGSALRGRSRHYRRRG